MTCAWPIALYPRTNFISFTPHHFFVARVMSSSNFLVVVEDAGRYFFLLLFMFALKAEKVIYSCLTVCEKLFNFSSHLNSRLY